MDDTVYRRILAINRDFYESYGDAFAATRRRIQPGVSAFLGSLSREEAQDWLDLGCGSGALGRRWAESGMKGSYTGLDFSGPLLREARAAACETEALTVRYAEGDLTAEDWAAGFPDAGFDGIAAFASLHHIPGAANHRRILSECRRMLRPGGRLILSVWQYRNSEKLAAREQPWESAGIPSDAVEPGDTLIDWRYTLPGEEARKGLRYVHCFTEEELEGLLRGAGFTAVRAWYSDGKEGNLALYFEAQRPAEAGE